MNNQITFLGETTFRNQRRKFGIKIDDRRRHVYLVGKTGMGKTVMMENMA
ncbi:MAG: type IV secretory system conjugative DNA transfer family protein, partial [Candidatus Nealsonbacteria bacterium]